ncbi:hypothetical protein EN786_29200 [Mesorhizobium sp. M4B.F.Ca.ET.143.01.1.1]|nr:hypothetical protein EOA31_32475 [Mesorhizobium sp. M4B.F.Ca.ET.049.02.1.2]RVD30871.1 hypothetical protein EN738_04465 [Mesorhizobium sp. M4B.F.Ca.ET.017.02.2.1]TGV22640.1 hypothetical protein EN786_29200 [Mesorhizobium sp. M4B.F.Ca.ET.143.01.1.1]
MPAGILSPYSDGERGRSHRPFRQSATLQEGTAAAASPFLPFTIRGEMPGRAMRGGVDFHSDAKCRL